MSRLSDSPVQRKALRDSMKVIARQELSAEQKVEIVKHLLSEARETEIRRLVKEKMAEESSS